MPKLKDLKEKNPKYIIDVIEILSELDPTKTKKYLPFMIKCTKDWVEWFENQLRSEIFKEMVDNVCDFEELSQKNMIQNKDIYSYKNNQSIVDAVKKAKEKITRSEIKKKETEVLYEDERWLIIYPLTNRSSNIYGKGTKWCVSSEEDSLNKYFTQYTQNGSLVFLIDKSVKEEDYRLNDYAKIAFHRNHKEDKSITLWNVKDEQISTGEVFRLYSILGMDIMNIINNRLENGPSNKEVALEKGITF